MTIIEQIKNRINAMPDGSVVTTIDFVDISSNTTVRKCLGRCVDEKLISRVFDGVYYKPEYSVGLDRYLSADPDAVANALARTFHWTIAPSGDVALNKLGLSTQVPVVWSYISDGPYRDFSWGNIKLSFKHRNNRSISNLSDVTVLVVEALRALGKENINDGIIDILSLKLSQDNKDIILREATSCSEWIYEIIRRICVRDEENSEVRRQNKT